MKSVSLSRISTSKTFGRLTALGVLFLSSLGPWFADTHPATPETCAAPLIWVGNGYCACQVSLFVHFRQVIAGSGFAWYFGLPPLLPILFTLLLFLGRNHRLLWYFFLAGWILAAIYSLFWFFIGRAGNQGLFLWGAGLYGLAAVLLLAWEIWTAKHRPAKI